jgi:hypothetical protein
MHVDHTGGVRSSLLKLISAPTRVSRKGALNDCTSPTLLLVVVRPPIIALLANASIPSTASKKKGMNGPDIEAVDEVKALLLVSVNTWKNCNKRMPSRSSADVPV